MQTQKYFIETWEVHQPVKKNETKKLTYPDNQMYCRCDYLCLVRYNSVQQVYKSGFDFGSHGYNFYCMLTILTNQSSFLEFKFLQPQNFFCCNKRKISWLKGKFFIFYRNLFFNYDIMIMLS